MNLLSIYEIGEKLPIHLSIPSIDKKLRFVEFQYGSKAVTGATLAVLIISTVLAFMAYVLQLNQFFSYFFLFVGYVIAIFIFIYPVNIFYTQRLMDYQEEMLKAIMHLSTFVSMNTSIEYAIIQTKQNLTGTLRTQFEAIARKLRLREKNTLGELYEEYTPIWNEVNPDFVKALRLVEIAGMSPLSERMSILKEVQESLLISYHTAGKRFAEDLSNKAKSLVALGVLFPTISLMLLPMISVFMPGVISVALLAFVYDVLFPAILLILALNFSAKRIQVDTIKLSDSPQYKPVPLWHWLISLLFIVCLAIPTILHLAAINTSTKAAVKVEYEFLSIFVCWLLGLGVFLAIIFMSYFYTRRYEKLWQEVSDTEQDVPYLLQTFSTYLDLNVSMENILPEIIDDYKTHGFGNRPAAKFFSRLMHHFRTTKKSIGDLTRNVLPKICPSKKVSGVLSEIVSFTDISQKSAARAAKIIRKQTIAIMRLDDYIRTLLSETVSLINVTTLFLAPMLSAAAVLMSVAIVKALVFIQGVLEGIGSGMGSSSMNLGLVDITTIMPPTVVEIIISIYLLELIVVLSIFSSNIKNGNDPFLLVRTLLANMIGFMLFSVILLFGYFAINNWVFAEFFSGA